MTANDANSRIEGDAEISFSIPDASTRMGVDSFTVYGLIHREKLRAKRAPWGEFRVPQSELDRVLQPSAVQPKGGTNAEAIC
jgi:hypothetical protein